MLLCSVKCISLCDCRREEGSSSAENHRILLVDEVLVEAPRDDATHALASYAGNQSPKIAIHAVRFVYFHKRICNARVVLRLILVVVLKVGTRANQVERICDHAADGVG